MKVLLVGAGAGYSTKDLEIGYYEAFRDLGIDLAFYLLDRRLYVAKEWLRYNWKHLMDSDPLREPGWPDVIYRGGVEALEMALRYNVDFVFIISAMYMHKDVLIMMRRAGLKTGVLFTESPYLDNQQASVAQLIDVCFTNERTSVDFLRQFNPNTHYIRHAYSPYRHFPREASDQTEITILSEWQQRRNKGKAHKAPILNHDVVFVGTGFRERIDLLSEVDWSGIDLGLYGNWALLPSRHKLRKYLRSGIMTNADAQELYHRAKIGLNLYRTSSDYGWKTTHIEGAESMNPRAYELAASKVLSFTEWRREQDETLDFTQPFFNDPAGLQRLLDEYFKEGMPSLEDRAFNKIQGHTFHQRAKEVLTYGVS